MPTGEIVGPWARFHPPEASPRHEGCGMVFEPIANAAARTPPRRSVRHLEPPVAVWDPVRGTARPRPKGPGPSVLPPEDTSVGLAVAQDTVLRAPRARDRSSPRPGDRMVGLGAARDTEARSDPESGPGPGDRTQAVPRRAPRLAEAPVRLAREAVPPTVAVPAPRPCLAAAHLLRPIDARNRGGRRIESGRTCGSIL